MGFGKRPDQPVKVNLELWWQGKCMDKASVTLLGPHLGGGGGGGYTPPQPKGDTSPGNVTINYASQAPGSGGPGGPAFGPGSSGGDGGSGGDHNVFELPVEEGDQIQITIPEPGEGSYGDGEDGGDVVLRLPSGREVRTKGGVGGKAGFSTDPSAPAIPGAPGGPAMTIIRYEMPTGEEVADVFLPQRHFKITSPEHLSTEAIWDVVLASGYSASSSS